MDVGFPRSNDDFVTGVLLAPAASPPLMRRGRFGVEMSSDASILALLRFLFVLTSLLAGSVTFVPANLSAAARPPRPTELAVVGVSLTERRRRDPLLVGSGLESIPLVDAFLTACPGVPFLLCFCKGVSTIGSPTSESSLEGAGESGCWSVPDFDLDLEVDGAVAVADDELASAPVLFLARCVPAGRIQPASNLVKVSCSFSFLTVKPLGDR